MHLGFWKLKRPLKIPGENTSKGTNKEEQTKKKPKKKKSQIFLQNHFMLFATSLPSLVVNV